LTHDSSAPATPITCFNAGSFSRILARFRQRRGVDQRHLGPAVGEPVLQRIGAPNKIESGIATRTHLVAGDVARSPSPDAAAE